MRAGLGNPYETEGTGKTRIGSGTRDPGAGQAVVFARPFEETAALFGLRSGHLNREQRTPMLGLPAPQDQRLARN